MNSLDLFCFYFSMTIFCLVLGIRKAKLQRKLKSFKNLFLLQSMLLLLYLVCQRSRYVRKETLCVFDFKKNPMTKLP